MEGAVITLVRNMLINPRALANLIAEPAPAEIATIQTAAGDLRKAIEGPNQLKRLAAMVDSGRIAPGRISVMLDREAVAKHMNLPTGRFDTTALTLESAFTLRRRGVEAKLVLDDAAPEIDRTLLRNIARGWAWLEEIKRGTPMQEIARREALSQRRIARLVDLGFLAPDIIEAVVTGCQHVVLTSDALIKSDHLPLWTEQRAMIAAL